MWGRWIWGRRRLGMSDDDVCGVTILMKLEILKRYKELLVHV